MEKRVTRFVSAAEKSVNRTYEIPAWQRRSHYRLRGYRPLRATRRESVNAGRLLATNRVFAFPENVAKMLTDRFWRLFTNRFPISDRSVLGPADRVRPICTLARSAAEVG